MSKHKVLEIEGSLPKVFGENWITESIAFSNRKTGEDLTKILYNTIKKLSLSERGKHGLFQIRDIWDDLHNDMIFTDFNKLLLSLWKNDQLTIHVNLYGKLEYISINRKVLLEILKK